MTEEPQIHIHRMIIHKVDRRDFDAPQISGLDSPVTDEAASFLRQHIVSNREHRYTRTASFVPPKEGAVCLADLCDRFVTDFLQCKIGLNPKDVTWTFASASHVQLELLG